jgi:hypothetical protein
MRWLYGRGPVTPAWISRFELNRGGEQVARIICKLVKEVRPVRDVINIILAYPNEFAASL